MSQIDDRLKALDAEREQLLALKASGVNDAKTALHNAVSMVTFHLDEAKKLADAFGLNFTIPMDYKSATYYPSHKQFIDNNDNSWSSSSLGC